MSLFTQIVIALCFYGLLLIVIRIHKKHIEDREKKVFLTLYLVWSISMFIANIIGYKIGIMSELPILNNFLHTFVWIGVCLSWLYLSARKEHIGVQFIAFAVFSLIVKYAEQKIFGTWEMGHFLNLFQGNDAYVMGWSFVDGFYPILSILLLKLFKLNV
ncbi:MAG: hypothetical protein ACE5IR_14520 [bacterium]